MLLFCMLKSLVYGFFVLKSATAFYRLPKLTVMFAKLKKCPLPTSELLLSRGIKKKRKKASFSFVKNVFLFFQVLELTNVC